jgi:hypothetical protein
MMSYPHDLHVLVNIPIPKVLQQSETHQTLLAYIDQSSVAKSASDLSVYQGLDFAKPTSHKTEEMSQSLSSIKMHIGDFVNASQPVIFPEWAVW